MKTTDFAKTIAARARMRAQMLAGGGREEVGDPIDDQEAPSRRPCRVESEQRDDPVDVDQEQRSIHRLRLANGAIVLDVAAKRRQGIEYLIYFWRVDSSVRLGCRGII